MGRQTNSVELAAPIDTTRSLLDRWNALSTPAKWAVGGGAAFALYWFFLRDKSATPAVVPTGSTGQVAPDLSELAQNVPVFGLPSIKEQRISMQGGRYFVVRGYKPNNYDLLNYSLMEDPVQEQFDDSFLLPFLGALPPSGRPYGRSIWAAARDVGLSPLYLACFPWHETSFGTNPACRPQGPGCPGDCRKVGKNKYDCRGYSIFQIDKGSHATWLARKDSEGKPIWQNVYESAKKAAELHLANRESLSKTRLIDLKNEFASVGGRTGQQTYPALSGRDLAFAMAAAYNSGAGGIMRRAAAGVGLAYGNASGKEGDYAPLEQQKIWKPYPYIIAGKYAYLKTNMLRLRAV